MRNEAKCNEQVMNTKYLRYVFFQNNYNIRKQNISHVDGNIACTFELIVVL